MHSDSNVGVRWPTVFNCYFLRNKKPVLQSAEEERKKRNLYGTKEHSFMSISTDCEEAAAGFHN